MSATLQPALAGVAVGVVVCVWTAPVLQTFLFGVGSRDPLTLIIASTAVLLTAAIAAALPARRALRANPAAALRAD